MKSRRLAGLVTLVAGLGFFSFGAHLYVQAQPEQRRIMTESLMRFSGQTPLPKLVRAPRFCFKTFNRRANRGGTGVVVEQECLAYGVNGEAANTLLARAVLEGIAAQSRM